MSGKKPDSEEKMRSPEAKQSRPGPDPYAGLYDLPHPVSSRHPQMSLHDRAAQFAPFSALTGLGEAIEVTKADAVKSSELQERVGVEEDPQPNESF